MFNENLFEAIKSIINISTALIKLAINRNQIYHSMPD